MLAPAWKGLGPAAVGHTAGPGPAGASLVTNADAELFDFHAQRGQMITALEQANVPLKTLQALARHSRVETTLRHYSRKRRLADSRAALDNLPPLPGTGPERDLLRATGTEGAQPRLRNACALGDSTSDGLTRLDTRAGGKKAHEDRSTGVMQKGFKTNSEDLTQFERKRPLPDSNRGIADLQSAALPLG
jgi:hypothetical protein